MTDLNSDIEEVIKNLKLSEKKSLNNIYLQLIDEQDENTFINLDTGERGYVKNIGIRSTRIMTRDDIEITIPNSVIANSKIINESGGPVEMERVRVNVSVAYGSDIETVRSVLMEIAQSNDEVCSEPLPRVRFREFADSGLKFQLLLWIAKPERRGRTVDEILSLIHI